MQSRIYEQVLSVNKLLASIKNGPQHEGKSNRGDPLENVRLVAIKEPNCSSDQTDVKHNFLAITHKSQASLCRDRFRIEWMNQY